MSYKTLEHATDAIIEVTADNLKEAFETAGISVIDTILDSSKVEENHTKKLIVKGKDLKYLLYNWLEEMIILTITDGFAGKKIVLEIKKDDEFEINAEIFAGSFMDFCPATYRVKPTVKSNLNEACRSHL